MAESSHSVARLLSEAADEPPLDKLLAAFKGILDPDPYITDPMYAGVAAGLIVVLIGSLFYMCCACVGADHGSSLGEKPSKAYVQLQRQISFERRMKKPKLLDVGAPPPSSAAASAVASIPAPDVPPPSAGHVRIERQKSFERQRKKQPGAMV